MSFMAQGCLRNWISNLGKPDDVPKIAFRMHKGQFMVMPFGLMNTPTTFQALMNSIFKGVLQRYVLIFFDDILFYSPSLEIHWEHLRGSNHLT